MTALIGIWLERFFYSLRMSLSVFPSAKVGCVCIYCEQDRSYFLVNQTVPLVFLVSEDIGTCGNNYDHAVLRTVFHSAFPTLLSTCFHIPLFLFLSLCLLSSFSLSKDGECWSIGVSSSFGLFLLWDLLWLVEKLLICTLQIQYKWI